MGLMLDMIDKVLICPCGYEIDIVTKMGIKFYKHKKENEYCKLLNCGDGVRAIGESLNNNFQEFQEHFEFKRNIGSISDGKTIDRNNPLIKKMLTMKGNKEALVKYLDKYKVYLKSYKSISNFIYTFGSQGEYLLKVVLKEKDLIGYNSKSFNAVDLGVEVKSDYDIRMKDILTNKETKKKAFVESMTKLKENAMKESW
jgi:hypothetical protein